MARDKNAVMVVNWVYIFNYCAMSFQTYFHKSDQENKELLAEFIKKNNELPVEIDKLISMNEKKLENFIEQFQNEIIALKNSEERDCKLMENISSQNQQRLVQILLLEDANTMQKNICAKMQKNNKVMEAIVKETELRVAKHQQNINRNQIDYQELQKKLLSQNKHRDLIEIDKLNNRVIVRFNKDGKICMFQLNYNSKQDKFSLNTEVRPIRQAVTQFNFHRNMNRLCADLYQFS